MIEQSVARSVREWEQRESKKAWIVGPYDHFDSFEWCIIVHRETRGQARELGTKVGYDDFTAMRAIRAPYLDGKIITKELLIENGWDETYEGLDWEIDGYIQECRCELCEASLKQYREGVKRAREVQN